MINHYFHLDFIENRGLQEQLREALLYAILAGTFPKNEALPSCRQLSKQLSVSRNTVALVYESLLDDGYLISRPRSGYYLHPNYSNGDPVRLTEQLSLPAATSAPTWSKLFKKTPSEQHCLLKTSNWNSYQYPFVYGQVDADRFPLEEWRKASQQIFAGRRDRCWVTDHIDQDDAELIHQLRTRVLPKRGIIAQEDEILITLGSQNALFLIGQLLFDAKTKVAIEHPGYPDMFNITSLHQANILLQPVDEQGMVVDQQSSTANYLYVTPSHQVPTGVTMSKTRRMELLDQACQYDQIIIEDDYDADINFEQLPLPALKSSQQNKRIIYLSSFSKSLSPGLRVGYMVADAELIYELRSLRRLMYRHLPYAIQHQLAQFLAQGHYDRYLRAHHEEMKKRHACLYSALTQQLPACKIHCADNSSSFWLRAPDDIDSQHLAWRAAHSSVLIEPGCRHYLVDAEKNYFRLGFGAIDLKKINKGVELLAKALDNCKSFN